MGLFDKKRRGKKRKKRTVIILALCLICIGVVIASYPRAMAKYFEYRQKNLMDSWMFKNAGTAYQDIPASPPREELFPSEADALDDEIFEEDVNAYFDFDYALRMMTGIIKIPSINLVSPILVGDTKTNLNIGVCEVRQSVRAGETGNYILAGHYSRIYGRYFNRLPEIKPGASVFVQREYGSYEYEITEILHVGAADTWAVPINVPERMITLITCDYSRGEPYGRVVVKGLLKQ